MEDFTSSESWLDTFFFMFIKFTCGKKRSVHLESVAKWKSKTLSELIKECFSSNIFNADETVFFIIYSQVKHFVYERKSGTDGKKVNYSSLSSERQIAIDQKNCHLMLSANPRCFKNVKTLPTKYDTNNKSWMTSILFTV